MLTNSELQVLSAITDASTFFVEMQHISSGKSGTLYTNPNLTFSPATSTLGLKGTVNVNGLSLTNNTSEKRMLVPITSLNSINNLTFDLSEATLFEFVLNKNVTQFTLLNIQPVGRISSFVLVVTADGTTRSVIWPNSFKWPSGTAPTITTTAGKKDVFLFFTVDAGTSWQCFITGQNL